jgi:hypothetical protein
MPLVLEITLTPALSRITGRGSGRIASVGTLALIRLKLHRGRRRGAQSLLGGLLGGQIVREDDVRQRQQKQFILRRGRLLGRQSGALVLEQVERLAT